MQVVAIWVKNVAGDTFRRELSERHATMWAAIVAADHFMTSLEKTGRPSDGFDILYLSENHPTPRAQNFLDENAPFGSASAMKPARLQNRPTREGPPRVSRLGAAIFYAHARSSTL